MPTKAIVRDIVAWDKLAESSNTYLRKGSSVLVESRLSMRSYQSKGGEKLKAAEFAMSFMQMLNLAAYSAPIMKGDTDIQDNLEHSS